MRTIPTASRGRSDQHSDAAFHQDRQHRSDDVDRDVSWLGLRLTKRAVDAESMVRILQLEARVWRQASQTISAGATGSQLLDHISEVLAQVPGPVVAGAWRHVAAQVAAGQDHVVARDDDDSAVEVHFRHRISSGQVRRIQRRDNTVVR